MRPTHPESARKPAGQAMPPALAEELRKAAARLQELFGTDFETDPRLKDRCAAMLRALLPPHGKVGRPAIEGVSIAVNLLDQLRRENPNETAVAIWSRIYPQAIPAYESIPPHRRGMERVLLRERVRARMRTQRRRGKLRKGIAPRGTTTTTDVPTAAGAGLDPKL